MQHRRGIFFFIGLWLVLLLVPSFRAQVGHDLPPALSFVPRRAEREQFYADDLDVRVEMASQGKWAGPPGNSRPEDIARQAKALTPLVKQHLSALWLRSLWCQTQLQGLNFNRVNRPLTNTNYPAPSSPSPTSAKISLPGEWEKLVAYAREGSRLDPKNSYFDGFVLSGLLALRRDKEAFTTLKEAANKPHCEDYHRDVVSHRLAALTKLEGPLRSGQPLSLVSNTLSVYALKRRQVARWIMENAIADRERGDKARALQWSWNLVQWERVSRIGSDTLIGALVSESLEAIGFFPQKRSGIGGSRVNSPGNVAALRADMRSAPFLARQMGQTELALQFEGEWKALGAWRAGTSRYFVQRNVYQFSPLFSTYLLNSLFLIERMKRLVLWALPPLVLFWILSAVLTRRCASTSSVSPWKWGLTLALLGLVLLVCGDVFLALGTEVATTNAMLGVVGLATNFFSSFSVSLVWDGLWSAGENEIGIAQASTALACFGIAGSLILLSLWLTCRTTRSGTQSLRQRVLEGDELIKFDLTPLFGLLVRASAWMVGIAAYFALLVWPLVLQWQWGYTYRVRGEVLYIGFLFLLTVHLLALSRLRERQGLWRLWLQNLRGVSVGGLVALALVYSLCLGVQLPLKARFDHEWTQYLATGELNIARRVGKF